MEGVSARAVIERMEDIINRSGSAAPLAVRSTSFTDIRLNAAK
jgi:hypothetical protein